MAFMQAPTSATGEIRPTMNFNAAAGRLFLRDRVQDSDGNWQTSEVDVTMTQPTFAMDFGRLETGWVFFAKGMQPMWALVPVGQQVPAKPPSPGNDANGKPVEYRAGFRTLVKGRDIGGVREIAGNSTALINGMNALHDEFVRAPEAHAGKIPLVKMTNVMSIKSGQATNFQPVFTIQAWVDRTADMGERTVPPPRPAAGATAAPAAPARGNGAQHTPPPAAAQPRLMPQTPMQAAPPIPPAPAAAPEPPAWATEPVPAAAAATPAGMPDWN